MNAFSLAWKNIVFYKYQSFISILLLGLGVGIVSLLISFDQEMNDKLQRNVKGIDLVVGAKGSPLQIILANVYHADAPTGNIPIKAVKMLEKHPQIKKIIKLAYGDSYKSFRILGTEHSYIEHYEGELQEGRLWKRKLEATIGSKAAKELNLKVGDTFHGMHGEVAGGHVHDEFSYKVVGILKPSGTVLDQLLLTNVATVWAVHGDKSEDGEHGPYCNHDHEKDHKYEPDDHAQHNHDRDHDHGEHEASSNHQTPPVSGEELTGLLMELRGAAAHVDIPKLIDQNTSMKTARPGLQIPLLLEKVNFGQRALKWLGGVIILLASISVFFSMIGNIRKRKYDIAILRTVGQSKSKVFAILLSEGLTLSILGYLAGLIISKSLLLGVSQLLDSSYNYSISNFGISIEEVFLLLLSLMVGLLASLVPAFMAYKTDIPKTLSNG